MTKHISSLVALLTLGSASLHAQQQRLVGVWQVTYPGGATIENGVTTIIMATGTLTIEAKADSLIATMVQDTSAEFPARPPVRLAAKAGAGDATFVARSTAQININGVESEATVVSTWVLRAKGDNLEGTVQRSIDGLEGGNQPPQPVTGTRKKE